MAERDQVSHKRQWLSGANAVVFIAASIVIAVLVNVLVSQVSQARIDLTENNIYTLSTASEDVVENLDQKVQVKAFISQDMPPPAHTLRRRVRDILVEYSAAAGDKLDFEVIAPGDSEEAEEDARGYGCEKQSIGQRGEDRMSLRLVYKCVAFVTADGSRQQVISNLQASRGGGGNFEYDFTKALMNLQDREPRKVGFVKGFGGPVDRRGFSQQIKPAFEQLFGGLIQPTTVDLSGQDASVPDDVSALVVLNVTKNVSPNAKYAIDQFVKSGGSVGWYQSSTAVDQQMRQRLQRMGRSPKGGYRKPLDPGVTELFSHYGVKWNKDLVIDRQNALAMGVVPTEQGMARISHPATFSLTNINRDLPFTRDFSTLAFPGVSSVTLQPSAQENPDLETYEIIKTAETAVRYPEPPGSLKYQKLQTVSDNEEPGPFTVAAGVQGAVPSYYEEHDLPPGVQAAEEKPEQDDSSSRASRILVVGNGSMYRPVQSLGYNRQLASMGGQFFISSIEWLVQDSALAQIRGKSMPRLIGKVEEGTKRQIQFINIAIVPTLFALLGVFMVGRRRRRRRRLERTDSSEETE